MQQSYYAVQKGLYDDLMGSIKNYNELFNVTFNKEISRAERLKVMEEKDQVEEVIVNSLKKNGQLLGFFSEKEFEDYGTSLKPLSDDIRGILGSNSIPLSAIEGILVELMQYNDNEKLNKLFMFLENARKQDKSIIVWII
jgi:hypothetical protein